MGKPFKCTLLKQTTYKESFAKTGFTWKARCDITPSKILNYMISYGIIWTNNTIFENLLRSKWYNFQYVTIPLIRFHVWLCLNRFARKLSTHVLAKIQVNPVKMKSALHKCTHTVHGSTIPLRLKIWKFGAKIFWAPSQDYLDAGWDRALR